MSVRLNLNSLCLTSRLGKHAGADEVKYSANNQVSFNGRIVDVIGKFSDKLVEKQFVHNALKNKTINNFLKSASNNPGIYEALIALGITCSIRPLTILTIPGAKKEDKQYAAAQSISSGAAGLGFAYMIYKPIETALDSILKDVNAKNVDKAIGNFYKNTQYTDLIEKLVANKLIPSANEIPALMGKLDKHDRDLFTVVKNFAKNNADNNLIKLMANEEGKAIDLLKSLNKALGDSFNAVKNCDIPDTAKYLVHKSIHYSDTGELKTVISLAANKTKYFLNQSSKFVLAPVLALVTIAVIPKVMHLIFPHRNKKSTNNNMLTHEKNIIFAEKIKNTAKADPVFKQFTRQKPAAQIAFTGATGDALKFVGKAYNKVYNKPASGIFKAIFNKVSRSKFFSSRMDKLMENAVVEKHGMKILKRKVDGTIMNKFDNNFFLNNLPQIISCWLSGFYVFNTIRNKKIEKERKPALCTNMIFVMSFSLLVSKILDKLLQPLLNAFERTHKTLMRGKVTYDIPYGWKMAYSLLICTFAFRYLGPVIATPAADRITKFLQKHGLLKKPNETEQTKK
ncbi:MAG: hypothetical protein PHX18_00795 [Candidatus Gastranaerophilales bacterium]|nr:hypothetical protein [Candidatus Gastranaerophilales bacterium]